MHRERERGTINVRHALRHMKKQDRVFFHRIKEEYRIMEEKRGRTRKTDSMPLL